jgi:hypothetical protein
MCHKAQKHLAHGTSCAAALMTQRGNGKTTLNKTNRAKDIVNI